MKTTKLMIKHFWENNREEIVKNSYKNCHCEGVDSICLLNKDGCRIRMFIAHNNHQLHKYNPLTVGYHPHHCDITIKVVRGNIRNLTLLLTPTYTSLKTDFNKYLYQSKIKTSDLKFKHIEKIKAHQSSQDLKKGESLFLSAKNLHTIFIPPYDSAIWLVFEGKEDPEYVPYVYTNDDTLENKNFDNLYLPMTKEEIESILKKYNLI